MGFFKKKNRKYFQNNTYHINNKNSTLSLEIVQITDRLIAELKEEFDEKFDRNINREMIEPLNKLDGKKEVEELLLGYIKDAVAKRSEISGGIAESILNGNIYQQYYKRMEEVSELTVSVYKKLHEMEAAEEDYLFQKNLYKQLLGESFIKIQEQPRKEKRYQAKSVMEEIHERDGN